MRHTMSMTRAVSVTLFGLASAGCHSGSYPVLVRALDDGAKPVAEVTLSVQGRALGMTDVAGLRMLELPGKDGAQVELSAQCPDGYDSPQKPALFALTRPADAKNSIEVTITCPAKDHVQVVALRTGQPGVPILLRGQAIALTNATGTAHVLVREAAGNSFELTLDTAARPELQPENPKRTFTVAERDAFAIWDQPLSTRAARSEHPARERKALTSKHHAAHKKPSSAESLAPPDPAGDF
jgi:hypothetical protein